MAAVLHSTADIFAANRATGHIALSVSAHVGRTRRKRVHEDGSLRVRFPNVEGQTLEGVIVNTGGGMTGGDRFAIEVAVESGASLMMGTAAAEKIYRSHGPDAEMTVALDLGENAQLAWLPQETILFDRARLSRRIDVDLAAGATLLMAEAVVLGRAAMGEAMNSGFFADRWRVRREGRLVYGDTARLDGAIAEKLAEPAITAGGIATPADAAMMMQLGAEGVFVGSGIFKSGNPAQRAEAIVKATTFFDDADMVAKVSRGLGEAMVGINVDEIPQPHRLAERGW